MVFAPLTELRSVRASSLTRALLSWVSSSVPLCRCPCSRPLPVRKRTFGQPAPTGHRVPFPWFLTTSTVCSGCSFAGLLHPATSIRFVAFPASLPANCRIAPDNRWGLPGRLPRRRFSHPSEFSPRQQPYRVTHLVLPASTPKHRNASTFPQATWVVHLKDCSYGRCPHDVPSRAPRCLSQSRCQDRFQPRFARERRLQGFAPLSSPLRHAFIAECASLATPLGLVPLQGLPSLSLRARLRSRIFVRSRFPRAASPGAE